jgi:hypothetical protein
VIPFQASPSIKRDHISKITKAKRAGIVAEVVKHLPSRHKVLSSTSRTVQKNTLYHRYRKNIVYIGFGTIRVSGLSGGLRMYSLTMGALLDLVPSSLSGEDK